MRDMLEDSIRRLLAQELSPEVLRQAEDGQWPASLWNLLEEGGFTQALVSEEAGGAGLLWADVQPVLLAAGEHALPLPLADTVLAAWLLDRCGMPVPDGPIAVADAERTGGVRMTVSGLLEGSAPLVPWGRFASHVVVAVEVDRSPHLALVPCDGLPRRDDLNLAREPRDTLVLDGARPVALARWPGDEGIAPTRLYGALVRSVQMAGAMQRLVQQSVQYAGERAQFGRTIGQFQAIQQQLAVLGCEAAASNAGAAFACVQAGTPAAVLPIAAAKVRVSEAAGRVASIAHATHGAIGFTYEHSLHFTTRRLWAWRSEFGHHGWWSRAIGAAVCNGHQPLWSAVTESALTLSERCTLAGISA